MVSQNEIAHSDWFQYEWHTRYIGHPRWHVNTVSSTQDFIKARIPNIKLQGALVVADYQRCGRGRLHRLWMSYPEQSILCSILLRPSKGYANLGILGQMMCLSICKIMHAIGVHALFKWPNDVLVRDKKCAGILLETLNYQGQLQVILGFGLNTNQDEDAIVNIKTGRSRSLKPTSLRCETNIIWQRPWLLMHIIQYFDELYHQWSRNTSASLVNQMNDFLAWKGSVIEYSKDNKLIQGKILGLDEQGHLFLDNGTRVDKIYTGEIRRCG